MVKGKVVRFGLMYCSLLDVLCCSLGSLAVLCRLLISHGCTSSSFVRELRASHQFINRSTHYYYYRMSLHYPLLIIKQPRIISNTLVASPKQLQHVFQLQSQTTAIQTVWTAHMFGSQLDFDDDIKDFSFLPPGRPPGLALRSSRTSTCLRS